MLRNFLFSLLLSLSISVLVFGNGQSEKSDPQGNKQISLSVLDAQAYALEEYEELLNKYKVTHPWIDIEIQHVANGHKAVRSARINSGQIPDILVGQSGSDVSKIYDYAYDFTDDPLIEKFTETSLKTARTEDGRILSLPWVQENMAIIYNKDLFQKVGISKLPTTIDELEEVCKTLDSAGITPFGVGFKETWVIMHIVSHFIGTENDNPRDIVNAISEGKMTFEKFKYIKNSFRLIDLMIEYGLKKPLEVGWEKSENMLANGNVAMIHMGDWAEAVLKEFNPDVNMAFMPMPVSNDPNDAVIMSYVSWQYVLNKDSENLKEAKELLKYILTSDEGADWMGNGIGSAPPLVDAEETSGMLSSNALQHINNNNSKEWNHVLWPSGFGKFLGTQYQEYILDNISADEVLTNLTEEWLFLAE